MDIDYSVIIRTMGTAGKKYDQLLHSISSLEPQPKHVIVVLPEGYSPPKKQLGTEQFFYCAKGMVTQRLVGLALCKSKYALFCDDDISFDKDFVKKLYEPVQQGLCSISVGPLLSFFPKKGSQSFCAAITASSVQTSFHKDHYVWILSSGGWSFNRNIDTSSKHFYPTQSAAWTCFFGDTDQLRRIEMEDELWLEKNQYAALDDQVMFYKAFCRKIYTAVVSNAHYEHLDAKTSSSSSGFSNSTQIFAQGFNRAIFWHRFIYCPADTQLRKATAIVCFTYRELCLLFLAFIKCILDRNTKQTLRTHFSGVWAGLKYLKSAEYRSLKRVTL